MSVCCMLLAACCALLAQPASHLRFMNAAANPCADGGSSEDTLVINRASLLKNTALTGSASKDGGAGAGTTPATGGKEQAGLLKPRRLGVLGKAQRVVAGAPGRPPLAPVAEAAAAEQPAAGAGDEAAAAAEANRKRKAEMEAAQSPNPQLQLGGVGEGKRRQSPCDEIRIGRAAGSAGVGPDATAVRPAERQPPPVPRFDEQRPVAAAPAGQTAAAEVVTTAAPGRPPPAAAPSRAAAAAAAASTKPAAGAAAGRQQVVLQECGPATRGGRREEAGEEEDETAPVVMSKLAQRVQRGRQSLAPSKVGRAACWVRCLWRLGDFLLHVRALQLLQSTPRALLKELAPLPRRRCRLCWAATAACCTAAALALRGGAARMTTILCLWPTGLSRQRQRRMPTPRVRWRGQGRPAAAGRRRPLRGRPARGCRLMAQAMLRSCGPHRPAPRRCPFRRPRRQRWPRQPRPPPQPGCPWARRHPSPPGPQRRRRPRCRCSSSHRRRHGRAGGWWKTKTQ